MVVIKGSPIQRSEICRFHLPMKTKGRTLSGYFLILSELVSWITVSEFLETINFDNQAIYNLKDLKS